MSLAKDRSKNVQCRELLELIKGMVEHFNKSTVDKIALEDIIDEMSGGEGSKAKLSEAVAQRWISVCQMLLRGLERWDAPRTFYLAKGESFPLTGKKDEVEEVYSMVNEVKGVIVYSQTTYRSTAQGGLQRLVLIATTTLDPKHPLKVKCVRAVGQGKEDVEPEEVRPSADLTTVARVTREAFARGVARRFVPPRYGKGLSSHSRRNDVAMFFTPGERGFNYLKRLKNSTVGTLGGFKKSVENVKSVIIGQVKDLLAGTISKSRARPKRAPVVVDVESRVVKRLKTGTGAAVDPWREELAAEVIMDSSSDEEGEATSTPETTPEEEAGDLIKIGREEKKLDGVD